MKLQLRTVVVAQQVKLHTHEPGDPCMESCNEYGQALYTVNVDTGECTGEVAGLGVHVDKDWWMGHCTKVGARVSERLKDIKL